MLQTSCRLISYLHCSTWEQKQKRKPGWMPLRCSSARWVTRFATSPSPCVRCRIWAQPQSDKRHVEEREKDRFLASVDDVLQEDRRQMAYRARAGLGAYRSGERQSVAESRALRV